MMQALVSSATNVIAREGFSITDDMEMDFSADIDVCRFPFPPRRMLHNWNVHAKKLHLLIVVN